MKNIFILSTTLILSILACILISCSEKKIYSNNYIPSESNDCVLLYEGEIVTSKNVDILYIEENGSCFSMIPVEELLEHLGFDVKWTSNFCMKISNGKDEWKLKITEDIVLMKNTKKEYINDVSGPTNFYAESKLLILNETATGVLLSELGIPCYIQANAENKTVEIVQR